MDKKEHYEVKDISLAEQGRKKIEFAESNMGALLKIKERFEREKPLRGQRIGMALHVTKETAVLVRTLIKGGAEVAITGCNPLSTQDDVAAALASEDVRVWAYKGETNEDYYRYLGYVINFKPTITIDDGCDLVTEIHTKYPELIHTITGGCEETTTGILRLKAMEKEGILKYPVIAVNDNKTKHLLDNYYGTGQSTVDGFIRATNILFAGKTIVVAGYGDCGKGFALRSKGLGGNVIVTEVDSFCALQAAYDGFRVMKMEEACKIGDIFCTLTGDLNVITVRHFEHMKDGAIVANSGHFDVEVDVKGLRKIASHRREVRPFLEEYIVNGKRIYLCAEGRLVNLAAAEGHPSEVMSTSFCGQALACEYLVKHRLDKKVIYLPEELDNKIAELQLEAMNIVIDELTEEQIKYLNSWKEGT
ncbi:MAG: adenosylhomocysteinase [Candidatus Nanoarchaeia archaeon]|nr:adenosylhomocysteinase [Candidatus Nanoarchaeia archaeon]